MLAQERGVRGRSASMPLGEAGTKLRLEVMAELLRIGETPDVGRGGIKRGEERSERCERADHAVVDEQHAPDQPRRPLAQVSVTLHEPKS